MTPINNSDTAWLIVSDFNQDNNLPYLELKEDIISPDVNQWCYEEDGCLGTVADGSREYVGFPNTITFPTVGGNIPRIIRLMKAPISLYVGGHRLL